MCKVYNIHMGWMTIKYDDDEEEKEGEDNDAFGTLELSKVRSLIRMQPMRTLSRSLMMMMRRKLMLRDIFRYDI